MPRFVFSWIKRTSVTPFLASSYSENRQQDGLTLKLLCSDCEQLLSKDEKQFAQVVFRPAVEDRVTAFEYGPWLRRFLIGLSWRYLSYREENGALAVQSGAPEAMEDWRRYLRGERPDVRFREHHLLINRPPLAPSDIAGEYGFTMRAVGASFDARHGLVQLMMPAITIFSITQSWRAGSEGTLVLDSGTYRMGWRSDEMRFNEALTQAYLRYIEAVQSVSPSRRAKIKKAIRLDPSRWNASQSKRSLSHEGIDPERDWPG